MLKRDCFDYCIPSLQGSEDDSQRHPDRSSGISHVEIHDQAKGNITKITDPSQIVATLIECNTAHFGQAQGTPFTTGRLKDLIGYEGRADVIDQIINGNPPAALLEPNNGAEVIIRQLSNGCRLPIISSDISFMEYKSAFRKWAEKTSTSPSGRHLGHYKVLFHTDGIPVEDESDETMNDHILQVYHRITTAALLSGNSLTRWQQATTAMIEKISGCPRIDKLRVMHLYTRRITIWF